MSSPDKQNPIFSLTLDEIQCKSGKCFGSMNMDEFLASVWNVDENQVTSQPNQNNDKNIEMKPALTRQGSISIPIPLCKKTVDEVWFEIQKDQSQHQKPNDYEPPHRQQTFEEMTLEDFLVKAGVVQEAPSSSGLKMVTQAPVQNNSTCLQENVGMGHTVMGLGFPSPVNIRKNMVSNGYATYPVFSLSKSFIGESSNNVENEKGCSLNDSSGIKNKKRIIDGPPEVAVERRQRRMIKNRESAARSRARKQVLY
ncbi:hypothetical protein CFOL_v3_10136 [Cephalotus follicularis]|uniref:BZIP domain-containing protein n=1 Tax=Cephalotus follicularis TaxID=3775 RepID=A0A1Q3BF19_CEPFO|nr:hypothetical protein CFOL_v3_10136 [Cephalotus follicularis]